MVAALFFVPTTTTLMSTIAKALGGFALYVGVLLLIDAQARELVRLIWQEILYSLKQLTHKAPGADENGSITGNS